MFLAAILSLLLTETPERRFTVSPGFTVTPGIVEPPTKLKIRKNLPPPKAVIGWHKVRAGEPLLPGNHWHTCPRCRESTQHSSRSFGNGNDHTCKCGIAHWTHSAYPIVWPESYFTENRD